LSFLYGLVIFLRNYLYSKGYLKSYQSNLPVISVGNLSVGGNGKTPLVLYIAQNLKEAGREVVVLSRGYGGSLKGPELVSEKHTAAEVGDEPLMLFQRHGLKVVIARKRVQGAKFIEENQIADSIILDDGFQHRALKRDLDLLCVYCGSSEAISDFQQGRLLPFGRFREHKQDGLRRADAVIFNARNTQALADADRLQLLSGLPESLKVFSTHLKAEGFYSYSQNQFEDLRGKRAFVFCALANPQAFIDTVVAQGVIVEGSQEFGDHHKFNSGEIEALAEKAAGAVLICSEKDAVKLSLSKDIPLYILKTSLVLEPEQEFLSLLADSVQQQLK
jgi:tetraacyldisaccharide 4'-kinase